MADNCVLCTRSLRRLRRHVLSERFLQSRREFVVHIVRAIEPPQEVQFDGTRSICHACWHRIDSEIRNQNQLPPPDVVPAIGASVIVPQMARVANTSRRCMMNHCNNVQLRAVPNSIKVHLLSYYRLYIPDRARICQLHLQNTALDEFSNNANQQKSDFNANSFVDIINMYTQALESRSRLDFENINEVSEDDLKFWTSLDHSQFQQLLDQVPSLRRRSSTSRTDLGTYLCKIRTGEPNSRIGATIGLSETSVRRKLRLTRACLSSDFVPLHIGLNHTTRNDVIDRNRVLPNHIFGCDASPRAIIICDGTYLFVEKSSNFLFQRVSYSLHKFRNLIKPFLIVCADGHILDVLGPYAATTSDAEIMTQILQNHDQPPEDNAYHYFLEEGDVFILDRGFRDAIHLLEEHGYVAHFPPSKQRGETQLTTDESNKSRLVTICRWVVETVNGKFKKTFKMFRHKMFNNALTNTFTDFKIAAALINCFQEPYGDSPYTNDFVESINRNLHKPNLLAEYVRQNNLNRVRVTFTRLDANNPQVADFPQLTYEELIKFAIGTYHVKIARSYCSEHTKRLGVYEMEVYRHSEQMDIQNGQIVRSQLQAQPNVLIRCRINSRHVRSKIYYTYILYNTASSGIDAIKEHYCSCIHGQRTLGSCAHVISVIYYLGWARHNDHEIDHPAIGLDSILIDLDT